MVAEGVCTVTALSCLLSLPPTKRNTPRVRAGGELAGAGGGVVNELVDQEVRVRPRQSSSIDRQTEPAFDPPIRS